MASVRDNIVHSMTLTMRRHDRGPSHETVMRMYLDDLARHGRGQLPSHMPAMAFIAWTVPIDGPTSGDVVESKKVGDGVFVFWKSGTSAIAYDLGWGRVHTVIFDNRQLTVRRKTLRNLKKKHDTPAMELTAPHWSGGVVVGFKVRYPKDHRESETIRTLDFIAERTGPDGLIE